VTWLRFAVWLVIGMALYAFYGRRHSRLAIPAQASPT
jgi:APA family basic amino acid/polyamine antiporter